MRILYHHRTRGHGAEGVHIRGLVRAFRELGHEVEVVCPPGVERSGGADGAPPPPRRGAGSAWSGFSRLAPQLLFELLELTYNGWSRIKLAGAIRRFRPELIYDRYALFHAAPARLAARHRIPLVSEINDATFIERSRGLVLRGLARRIERRVLDRSALIVTVSNRFRDMLTAAHGTAASRVVVTPNAVDPGRFDARDAPELRARLGLEGRRVIGAVGAFVPWHGLDYLVDSVQGLLAARGDAQVLLVGDGPVRAAVERQVQRLGLDGRVRFTGFVPPEDVPRYLACMDVCLMPDSNEHGSPIKIFEYMAMGKAVVAPRYAPIEEVLEDGRTGLLFPPRDPDGLRRAIERLLDDAALRERLGDAARARVLATHTWRINAEAVLAALSRS